jgi:hypothetical protein
MNLLKSLIILNSCAPRPETRFCIAVEEGEAWFLGDITAIKSAYSSAKDAVLVNYVNDAICDTWEVLADAIYKGGASALAAQGWQKVGAEKFAWAKNISPYMDVHNNNSASFCNFRDQLLQLSGTAD